jgi:O-antigen ligase
MRKIALVLLWLYVFTVPWDVVAFPGVGTFSRLVGLLAIAAGLLTTLAEARFRKPGGVIWAGAAFTAMAALSLFWTVDYNLTVERVWSYAQLLASVWLIQELTRTKGQLRAMFIAWCLGGFIPMVGLLMSFVEDRALVAGRFTSEGALYFNANDMGLTLVLGIPVAWYLTRDQNRWVRLMSAIYVAVAPLGVVLTGSRGSFLAGLVALAIIPLTIRAFSFRLYATLAAVLVVGGFITVRYVPESSWARLLTIQDEVSGGGTMSGRTDIWNAGLSVAFDNPILGVGAGAYAPAVMPVLHYAKTSHNSLLSITVEQGLVGLTLFVAILGGCTLVILRLSGVDRALWAVTAIAWLIGAMSVGWETRKLTWLLVGLLAAQPILRRAPRRLMETAVRQYDTGTQEEAFVPVRVRSSVRS